MDSHSPHLNAANRSRSSQTPPSPSHSASAKIAASEDLESIARRGADTDSYPEESEDDEFAPEQDQDSSIRTFTGARLDSVSGGVNGSSRNAEIKTENLDRAPDDAKIMMKETLQGSGASSGAYIAREEALKLEEKAGHLKFACYSNDGVDEHMMCLIALKNIFAKQLPNMPKVYILRLLMDSKHKSVMVQRRNVVVGGITYRPYRSQRFGEIAFCAITGDEQVKGYGTRLMNHLKQHARDVDGLTHFLTYADKHAVGYFLKQGFTKEIYLEKEVWYGFIKDYDGVLLMECKIDPKLPYTDLSSMICQQRKAIDDQIKELSECEDFYQVPEFQKKEGGSPKRIRPEDIPGLKEAGWTPDQWGHTRYKVFNGFVDNATKQKQLNALIRMLLKTMQDHGDAWPFKEPVDILDVPDYYDVIKDPIDLKTIAKRVESEEYYVTLDMFVADVRRMFNNCRSYNSPETMYYKFATRLEAHFHSKLQAALQSGAKSQ
ncbi:unnamed protein product [Eruca vesicaria subsp. sativa]|uniref:histone acetyltransferase n=1 Tax=Eruca vesicaria subsp. sativa TaxID=29727 RepID=A0ABC8LGM5_ERUVS|nr:unnamed protein product [Eruca vesicaria subsp. sativa]